MEDIKYENYCMTCDHTIERDIPDHECPECGKWMQHTSYIICECGQKVYLSSHTNECNCGAFYNSFGQCLSNPIEWDEEDRCACFGPQNELE